MHLSSSFRRNILETAVGRISNKFKIRERRYTLFFEDILANYFKECQNFGYEKEIRELGKEWSEIIYHMLTPEILKKLPPLFALNTIIEVIWIQIGALDKFEIVKKGESLIIQTENEMLTRVVGKNEGSFGFYAGTLSIFFKSEVTCVDAKQTKEACEYRFKIENRPIDVKSKNMELYNKLNKLEKIEGLTLKDALRKDIFQLDTKNRIRFRGKRILPVESTFEHLISNKGPLLEKVPQISYDYFEELVQRDASEAKKLILLKTLLQVMGWGIIKIVIENENEITVEIRNPPYGLQSAKDNWDFLIKTILGYLWLIDKRFKTVGVDERYKRLVITYSKISQ